MNHRNVKVKTGFDVNITFIEKGHIYHTHIIAVVSGVVCFLSDHHTLLSGITANRK
jgi:hypothetical protein